MTFIINLDMNNDATYFIDSNGYFVKRENKSKIDCALTSDDLTTRKKYIS